MHTIYADYLARLEFNIEGMKSVLEGQPVEALDWVPGPDMNSLAVLVAHTAGSCRFWVDEMVTGTDVGRDREAEFAASGATAEDLIARLDGALAAARRVLEPLSPEALETSRHSQRHDRDIRLAWSLLHALDHAGQHLGHMQITRQLWEQRRE